ncbi:hypothetical protein PPACK8108_LOCUS20622 [Phakopsora pachyrhizi]|uniref:BZIP domain-containing protein n=1 Tax=Phakopsora pachyrhizi TaxID=170000 RepID=A0AAV0BGD3_PHAPC|nr:hypothetical protein PPACK8108_LOCUS20622 [Phakopsora pachyrhizi]
MSFLSQLVREREITIDPSLISYSNSLSIHNTTLNHNPKPSDITFNDTSHVNDSLPSRTHTHHHQPCPLPPLSSYDPYLSSSSNPSESHQTNPQQSKSHLNRSEIVSSPSSAGCGRRVTDHDPDRTPPSLTEPSDHHHPNGQQKRRRLSTDGHEKTGDQSQATQSGNLSSIQLAQAMAMVQAKQQRPGNVISPLLLSISGLSPDPTCQSNSSARQLTQAELELSKRIDIALSPLRLEISRLRSRIEVLEEERLATTREISFLKNLWARTYESRDHNIFSEKSEINPISSQASKYGTKAPSLLHSPSEILTSGQLHSPFDVNGNVSASSISCSTMTPKNLGKGSGFARERSESVNPEKSVPAQLRSLILGNESFTVADGDAPFRRHSSRKKPESLLGVEPEDSPSSASNRAKHRKPELSRTVRATVFRLMGVSSSNSPSAQNASLPGESKFGSEKTRAYHGYTTTPCFPEFSENLFDSETNTKLWRWDWSKTIRQSQNNTSFAKEIRHVIVKEAADPIRPMHTEVPPGDWQYLDDAIDSAYTNMRRERENLLDPNKMVKKEVHRARNKKRGLKEDKYKRRKKAFEEYKSDPKGYANRLKEMNWEFTDRPVALEADLMNSSVEEESYQWDDSLDLKYMSSEDEANVNDFENPISIGTERAGSSLAASDKVFAICRPAWRSKQLQNFFSILDVVKQPERAYRRVMGSARKSRPPVGTPVWSEWLILAHFLVFIFYT